MSAADPIRQLAASFQLAGQRMQVAAARAVQREAVDIEADAKSINDPIVVAYPQPGMALLTGTERRGVAQETSGSASLADVDLGAHANSLASNLLDQGVGVILGGN